MYKVLKIVAILIGASAATPALAQNRAPSAVTDYMTVSACNYNAIDVLANDSDPDGDAISVTGFSGGGNWGWWNAGPGGNLSYWAWWSPGTDVLTYTIQDSYGATAQGTLYVEVTEAHPGDC